jgi:isocitrate lyase
MGVVHIFCGIKRPWQLSTHTRFARASFKAAQLSQKLFLVSAVAGMSAYAELQAAEFAREKDGYKATRHQKFVGTGYFDQIAQAGRMF